MAESSAPIRGHIRTAGFRQVSHGLFLPDLSPGSARSEWLRELDAWRLVLPANAVFTHITASAVARWWVPTWREWVPTFAAVGSGSRGPRRPGIVLSRFADPPQRWLVDGVPLAEPGEILLRCARDLGMLDLVPLIDSALRAGVPRADLDKAAATSRPGCRALRRALSLSDARSESAWETKLRLFHVAIGVPVEPQVQLFDERGLFLGRADLLVRGTNSVHEYDGAGHGDRDRRPMYLRRERRLAGSPYVRRGYTADDILNYPLTVLREIDEVIGRRHRPERLRPWRRMVAGSTHSYQGVERLRNRWVRNLGPADWSETA